MAEHLRTTYERRFAELADYRDQVWKRLCGSFFQKLLDGSRSVLDVGCGWGEFINNIRVEQRLAMDLNPAAAERLDPSVQLLAQDCSEPWPLADGSLDTVFSSNFFEHLPDKPALARTLAEAFRCLRPGGQIICLGPNLRYTGGQYWDFWDHHLPLTDASLSELLELQGFTIKRCIPRWLPFSMSTGFQPPVFLIGWYLKVPLLWRLFGAQFLVVAERPDA